MKNHIQRALVAKHESKYIDFKSRVDFTEPHSWCEIVKDIVAMANIGGGVLLIGLDNRGIPTGFDPSQILDLDEATVTDRIQKYTGVHFDAFTISEETKEGNRLAAILIEGVTIPLVFIKPGTYAVSERKQKTAFSAGTVYFRHGAKSEPGNTNDLRLVIERQLESIRKSWLQGVRKVVKAPPGSQIYSFPQGVEVRESSSLDARAIRIVDDIDAPAYHKLDYDLTHPFRQTEAIEEINRGLADRTMINSFDIQCINRVYEIWNKENFCHCPKYSSPQYSREYVNWVINQYEQDNDFFQKTRKKDYEQRN
jgi:hypothetical protein